MFTGYVGPDDLIMPQLRTWAARKGKEEVELQQARLKMKELRKPSAAVEESAAAAADGSLPAGSKAKTPEALVNQNDSRYQKRLRVPT